MRMTRSSRTAPFLAGIRDPQRQLRHALKTPEIDHSYPPNSKLPPDIRTGSRPFRTSNDLIQLSLNLVHLANRILPLCICDTEFLLQLLDAPLLSFRVVLEPRERGYDELDLLFLQHQVARELDLACFELFWGDRCNCFEDWLDNGP